MPVPPVDALPADPTESLRNEVQRALAVARALGCGVMPATDSTSFLLHGRGKIPPVLAWALGRLPEPSVELVDRVVARFRDQGPRAWPMTVAVLEVHGLARPEPWVAVGITRGSEGRGDLSRLPSDDRVDLEAELGATYDPDAFARGVALGRIFRELLADA